MGHKNAVTILLKTRICNLMPQKLVFNCMLLYEENTLNQTNSDGKWMLYYEKNILMKNGNWLQTTEGTKATGCTKNHKYYLKTQYNFIDDD